MTNKEIVRRFYEKVFNAWDLSDLDQVMREDYIQHSPEVEEGREGFVRFMKGFLAAKPHAEIIHLLEDGDMVCVFFRCVLGGSQEVKVFDLYRLEDGKLAEHWDCMMATEGIPVHNRHGHF